VMALVKDAGPLLQPTHVKGASGPLASR
jgi:hypothetical protein